MNLSCMQLLVLHTKGDFFWDKHCATIVLYFVFWVFAMNYENQSLIWLKFHKFPCFSNIINSKGTELFVENYYLPPYPAEFVFGPWELAGLWLEVTRQFLWHGFDSTGPSDETTLNRLEHILDYFNLTNMTQAHLCWIVIKITYYCVGVSW